MKQKFLIFVMVSIVMFMQNFVCAENVMRLEGSVTKNDEVPEDFYGVWLVSAQQVSCTNPDLYNSTSVEVWTLTKNNNIIILTNPFSGASAAINVEEVQGNTVKFSRVSQEFDEIGYESPTLTINGETFEGVDEMVIKRVNHRQVLSEDIIKYRIKGKKISNYGDMFR